MNGNQHGNEMNEGRDLSRLRYRVLLVFMGVLLLVCGTLNTSSAGQSREASPKPTREPGVRLQIFRMAAPMQRIPQLVPGQTANLDRTIGRLALSGAERFMEEYTGRYLAVLTAQIRVKEGGVFSFRLASHARANLRVAGNDVLADVRSIHGMTGSTKLEPGVQSVEVLMAVNDVQPHMHVEWAANGKEYAPVPEKLLTAESFYFRPTAPGVKKIKIEDDRPGLRQKVLGVYPGLDITTIHPPGVEVPVGGLATLSDGTLVVARFDARTLRAPSPGPEPNGELWLYHGAGGDPEKIRAEKIAEGLFEPAGLCTVGDVIYVSQRAEVTRFDRDAQTGMWQPTTVASGWRTNDFHGITFGLAYEEGEGEHPGTLYAAKGTGLGLFKNPPMHGSVWRIDLSLPLGQNVETISGGHRTPNGLGWGPEGTLLVTDNQGEYTPANELNVIHDGAFYGFYQTSGAQSTPSPFQPGPTRRSNQKAVTEAAVWLPQNEISNSPAEPLMIPQAWPFAGQVIVCDVRYGGINRIFMEKVGDTWQGAVFRFTQGCEGGLNRMAFGPDGALYVGAIGGDHASTWAWVDPQGRRTYNGLQRLKPNNRVPFDMEHVRALPGGFELRFTQPISVDWLGKPENYTVQQWTYEATRKYGGEKKQLEDLQVKAATPAADGLSVALAIDGLKPNRLVYFLLNPKSVNGEEIWSAEAWYTLKRLPARVSGHAFDERHVVFVTGDDEYGSEVSMPMLASILEQKPGFRVTVLKAVDDQGKWSRSGQSIPGLRALRDADAAVFFMRFRRLPDQQVKEIEDYVASGRPVLGLRTSTHAFKYKRGPHVRLNDGFGQDIFGQKWISHYGHGSTSQAWLEEGTQAHSILRGLPHEFDLRSWLYVMNRESTHIPEDCEVLISGRALREVDGQKQVFGDVQPVAWTRLRALDGGKQQRVFYTSLGHPQDFLDVPSRRLLLNAIYWAVGLEGEIPDNGVLVPMPEGYAPGDPK